MKSYFEFFAIGFRYIKNWYTDEEHDGRIGMAPLIVVLFFYFTHCMIEDNNLQSYGKWTVGAVYDIYSIKASDYYRYQFYVDGVRYTGDIGKGISKICIGDSLYVHYDRTNPSNNAPGRYFEYVLDTEQLPDTVYYRRKMNNQRRPLIYQ